MNSTGLQALQSAELSGIPGQLLPEYCIYMEHSY